MQERLNRITEDFQAANSLKRELESKEIKTQDDLEQLEIIESWLKDLSVQINEWAEEYNNAQTISIEDNRKIEETPEVLTEIELLTKQLEENSEKLNEIKHKSQSLQPKFESEDKKRKHEILESLGFVLTKTADNRDIRIHPTLVGQYYDLTKERRRMLDKWKELQKESKKKESEQEVMEDVVEQELIEEIEVIKVDERELSEYEKRLNRIAEEIAITKELKEEIDSREVKTQNDIEELEILEKWLKEFEIANVETKMDNNQQRLSKIIAGKGMGKKDYITYDKAKYWIPKKYKSEFIRLMKEQKKLSKELMELTPKANEDVQKLELPAVVDKQEKIDKKEEIVEDLFKVIEENLQKNLDNLDNKLELPAVVDNKEKVNDEEKLLPIIYKEIKNVKKDNGSIKNKVKENKKGIVKSIIEKMKNTKIYRKYKEYVDKIKNSKKEKNNGLTQEQKEKIEKRKNKIAKNLASIAILINQLQNKENRTEQEEQDLQKLLDLKEQNERELEQLNNEKAPINNEVKNVRKSSGKIKEKSKKNLKKVLLRLAVTAGLVAGIMAGIKSCNVPEQQPIVTEENTLEEDTKEEKDDEEDLEKETKKDETKEKELDYFVVNEKYDINGKIYENMYDASEEKNAKSAYFGENSQGYIVGWGIELDGETVFVSRDDVNYKEKLETLTSQGGKVTTYAISDANSEERAITGFYNEEQVGRSR